MLCILPLIYCINIKLSLCSACCEGIQEIEVSAPLFLNFDTRWGEYLASDPSCFAVEEMKIGVLLI
jgi:hypothetical protein